MPRKRKPSWWLLNTVLIGMIAGLFLSQKIVVTTTPRIAAQIGIVVFGYWLMWRWLKANASALEQRKDEPIEEDSVEKPILQKDQQMESRDPLLNPQQVRYLQAVKARRR